MSTLFGDVFQNRYVVRDMAAALRHWTEVLRRPVLRSRRCRDPGQSGNGLSTGSRFVYFDTETHPGTVTEIIEASDATRPFHAMIRDASRGWDGRDPIRRIALPR